MQGLEEKEYTKSFDWKIWKRLIPFLKPYRMTLCIVLLLNLLTAFIDILLPLFQRYAVDSFIEAGTLHSIGIFGSLYALVILVQSCAVIIFTRRSMNIEMKLGRDLKRACFIHLQTLSLSYYNTTPVGYMLARVMSDTNRIASTIAWSLIDIMWGLSYVVGVFITMLLLDIRLALPVILIAPAIAIITAYFQNKILFWNRRSRKINSRMTSAFNEGIMGVKTTKTLGIEDSNLHGFMSVTDELKHANVKAARLGAIFVPLVLFISTITTAIVLTHGGLLVKQNIILLGTLSAFTSYAVSIYEPIQQLARLLSELIAVQANIERVDGLLSEKASITDSAEVVETYGDIFQPKKQNWEPLKGDIEFRNVSFKYPDGGDYVLQHFNLKIPAGTTVAIVGETGAGKSTLVNLVCRFFEPTEGQILIDGRDYRERSQLWLHSNIGYVLQTPHLFTGSIMDNIRYGKLDASDQEVYDAAASVSADTVVKKLKNGYESDVGEGGDNLSTGEKQLISFARAILADPRIFVLDEATSSIDTITEQLIQSAIERLLLGRTSFLIAHRLSTIQKADLILVVRDGKIVEQGCHTALLAQKGYYYALYSQQYQEESSVEILKG